MNFGGDHPAHGDGKISPRCIPKLPAMARLCPDVSPSCRPWQDIALMRSRRGIGQEKHRFVAIYRRHVFGFSLFWQDMRAMYPESPAKRRWGMHRANILPPRGVFAVRSTRIMHGARILPSSDGLVPAPAPRQYLPLAVPIAVGDKPPMGFGGDHPAHGLQFGQAPRDRRRRHLDGQADNGMLRRAGPGFQNREQVGAEPPAEAAGPAGPASTLPKTPIERTSPSWRNSRNTPPLENSLQ